MAKISGPLLDRIDLHIEVPAVPFQELAASQEGTSSATMRGQVSKARAGTACSVWRRQRAAQRSHDEPAIAKVLRAGRSGSATAGNSDG